VEPIGFPFRFGIVGNLLPNGFDFDRAGDWLLTASARGMLHAWRVDGSAAEILPRAVVSGEVLTQVEAVLGVTGGFVVCGRVQDRLAAAHYDFTRRSAKVYVLGPAASGPSNKAAPWQWYYFPELHSVVVRERALARAVDLDTGGQCPVSNSSDALALTARACQACSEAFKFAVPPPRLNVLQTPPKPKWRKPLIYLEQKTGKLVVEGDTWAWLPFTPLADGLPMLKDQRLLDAKWRGTTLAALVTSAGKGLSPRLRLFRGPEGVPLAEYAHVREDWGFTLSSEGQQLARQTGNRQVEIRDLRRGSVWRMRKGKYHNNLIVGLGNQKMTIQLGEWTHFVRWDGQDTPLRRKPGNCDWATLQEFLGQDWPAINRPEHLVSRLPLDASWDKQRFIAKVDNAEVTVLVDSFGQLAVFNRVTQLIAMFFVLREQIAAWLPDGTRYGPASITGGPETPDALTRIADALRKASDLRKEDRR
jgi:hypothetical protein